MKHRDPETDDHRRAAMSPEGRSRSRGHRTGPHSYKRPSYPSGSLLVFGLILGAFAAIAWQIWQFLAPMLTPPAKPIFNQVAAPSLVIQPSLPSPRPSPSPTDPGQDTQQRRVIEPLGLIFRQDPGADSPRIGGIILGETVTLLGKSPDGLWEQVRRELNGQEGWVKAGNLGSLTDPLPTALPQPSPRPTPVPTTPVATSPELAPAPAAIATAKPVLVPAPVPVSVGGSGKVVEPQGLILRDSPTGAGTRVGGIPVGETLTVIGTSPDQQWQRVRRASGEEGWIKAGNLGQ